MPRRPPASDAEPDGKAVPSLPLEAARALLDALPFPVLSADPHGILVGGNAAARSLLGCALGP